MNDDKLEQYLAELESHLADFPPSKRSRIVWENHERIKEAKAKYPDQSLAQILKDLGQPQKVANQHRLAYGFKTFKRKRHPFLKWFSITFLGSLTILFVAAGILVWKLTPLAKFDEENQRMILLGGLIDISGTSGKIKVFDQYQFVENRFPNQFDGAFELSDEMNEIVVNFDSGVMNFTTGASRSASWNCKLQLPPGKDIVTASSTALTINLGAFGGSSCDIEVPVDSTLTVVGADAEINVTEPEYDAMVDFKNGSINFAPNPEVEYNYDIQLGNGNQDEFSSSEKPNAYEIKLYLKNGDIRRMGGP